MQRFALVTCYFIKKQPLPLVEAVAFLMFFFSGCLPDTDNCHDNTDDSYHDTDKPYYYFKHHLLLFPYFPYVSPPLTLEVLKMYSFWQKANRLPFR